LNGTGKLTNPEYPEQWLQPDDRVELQVEGLGTLRNTIVPESTDYSILQLKK
jgi:fumarylacetoacetate (FAA) hydrolase